MESLVKLLHEASTKNICQVKRNQLGAAVLFLEMSSATRWAKKNKKHENDFKLFRYGFNFFCMILGRLKHSNDGALSPFTQVLGSKSLFVIRHISFEETQIQRSIVQRQPSNILLLLHTL